MGRKKKWRTDGDRARACQLRGEINPNTEKPWTDKQIMERFGYFDSDNEENRDKHIAKKADIAKRKKTKKSTNLDTEITIDGDLIENMLVDEYLLSDGSPSKDLRQHMMDFWKTKHKVPDDTGADETIDLSELIEYSKSKYPIEKPNDILPKDRV
ncbi:unnamed protein product [marine sediment metagenome]|uniref:Uncharacterized protein n=1 Tax=marine sediment metagenome TaxID=412755 RepID=X1RAA0_9ZZZZ